MTLRIILLVVAAMSVTACGSEAPYCGDGDLNEGEECDDANDDDTDYCLTTCKARQLSSLTVKWAFNRDDATGFTGDACIDMRSSRVEVELLGGAEPLVLSEKCSFKQVVFIDIPAATYSASVKVLDKDDIELTSASEALEIIFPGGIATKTVLVPPERWLQSYLGTFFFRVEWAGADCSTATPAVVAQKLTLLAGGEMFSGTTTDGAAMNGTADSTCQSLTEEFPQSALDVPFGAATFSIKGIDSEGNTAYKSEFETFVGAGVNNPELVFSVDLSAE